MSSRHQEVLDSRELIWLPVNKKTGQVLDHVWGNLLVPSWLEGACSSSQIWEPFWFLVHEIGCLLDLRGEGTPLVSGITGQVWEHISGSLFRFQYVKGNMFLTRCEGTNCIWSRLKRMYSGQDLRELAQFSVDEKCSRPNIGRDLVLGVK